MHVDILIRHASKLDEDRIVAFFEQNPSIFIRERGEDELLAALENQTLFIAQTLQPHDGARRIIAVSALYELNPGSSDVPFLQALDTSRDGANVIQFPTTDVEEIAYWEAGSSIVAAEYRGARLHPIFHCCRILHVALTSADPDSWEIFTKIADDNTKSVDTALKSGWVAWPEMDLPAVLKSSVVPGKTIYRFGKDRLSEIAANLMRGDHVLELRPTVLDPKTKERKKLTTSKFLNVFIDLPMTSHADTRADLLEIMNS